MALKSAKMSKFWTTNFDFHGHLATFRAENTLKSRPFKVKNNAQTLPEQLQNNFEKVQKIDFFDPQNGQNTGVNIGKKGRFLGPFSRFEL